jgi:hypothetical protein
MIVTPLIKSSSEVCLSRSVTIYQNKLWGCKGISNPKRLCVLCAKEIDRHFFSPTRVFYSDGNHHVTSDVETTMPNGIVIELWHHGSHWCLKQSGEQDSYKGKSNPGMKP